MKRIDFYKELCLKLYDDLLGDLSHLVIEVGDISEKSKEDEITNISANAYEVSTFITAENRMLRVIGSQIYKLPNGVKTKNFTLKTSDIIDENYVKAYNKNIDISKIEIPEINIFEDTLPHTKALLNKTLEFIIFTVATSGIVPSNKPEDLVNYINEKILIHLTGYSNLGLVRLSKNVKGPIELRFDDDINEEEEVKSKSSVIYTDNGNKFLN